MPTKHELLAATWHLVGRHRTLSEVMANLLPVVGASIPTELVVVRRIDLRRGCLETVAVAAGRAVVPPRHAVEQLSPQLLERLVSRCRVGGVHLLRRAAGRDALELAIPPGVRSNALVGPLLASDGPLGVVLLAEAAGHTFDDAHAALAEALLEPLATMLENHCRLFQIRTEYQAARADRQSLLTRLGQPDGEEMIVGAESGLREVMEGVAQVSQSDVPVLIFGETGSGKEVVARSIHSRSRRAAGPFLRVNCGAIPTELVDSELFGHERGSFTGATQRRQGWFERSDGGTLFLDEIAELSLAAQVRLLRVLQDGTFERVGGQQAQRVDVRVVAATHRDLRALVAEGRFREDLWYRLAVFPIELPALRDRIQDMPALATHFAERASRRLGLPYVAASRRDIDLLCTYPWPGNIRELAAVIDRAAILGNGERLEIARALGLQHAPLPLPRRDSGTVPVADPSQLPSLDEVARRHIKTALEAAAGRVEGPHGAARLLGINPHTLRGRMRKLGIDWSRFRRARPAAE
jgi:transcriptional regulator with GAF, ATPase, and Fis domain